MEPNDQELKLAAEQAILNGEGYLKIIYSNGNIIMKCISLNEIVEDVIERVEVMTADESIQHS